VRLIFMGTPGFAAASLAALIDAGHDVAAVYARPPRPAGRGQRPDAGPVARLAAARGLEVRTPATLRDPAEQAAFAALGAEAAVVVAYGSILPVPVLEAPARGCFNVHASLLPRWRGAAPIERAVLAGDAETGVSIMAMEAGLDTGPVLLRAATQIGVDETAGDLRERLATMGARLIVEALDRLDALEPETQPASGVSYAAKIDKAEARVDWSRPAAEVDRLVRGLSPSPGAWTTLRGERLRLLRSTLADGAAPPGRVLDDRLTVACGSGAVRLVELQRPGRGPVATAEFLRGHPVGPGATLD
jgi:methionyl-tRNA formyltransferase